MSNLKKIWSYSYDPLRDLLLYHFEQLTEESGLKPDILQIARPFSLNGRFVNEIPGLRNEILDRLSLPKAYAHDLLIFPYPMYEDLFRARLDVPEKDKEGRDIRYKQPKKQRNVPYIMKPIKPQYEDIIFITEGEKKTISLVQAGCNVIGFGGVWNWRDKSSPTGVIPDFEGFDLVGKTVAIVFDSDIATNKEVLRAEENLVDFCLSSGAIKVLRVRIPYSSGQKTGIDDYLKDYGWHEIDNLLKNAVSDKGFISGEELMNKVLTPSTMLTSFLPARAFVLVAGVPGAGKTEFLINQTVQAAEKGKVLYYINEGGLLDLQKRQRAYCRDEEVLKNIFWEQRRLPDFSKPYGITHFERVLKTYKPKAVFIDPGPDAFGEENDAAILKEPLSQLYQLSIKYDLCILLSWHFSKVPSYTGVYSFRGSSAIAGKMDLMYDITASEDKRYLKLDKLRIDCSGLRQGQKWIIDIESAEDGKEMKFIDVQEVIEARNERKKELLSTALFQFEPGNEYTSTEILKAIIGASEGSIKEGTAKKYLKEWVSKGALELILESRGKRPAIYKRLNPNNGESYENE